MKHEWSREEHIAYVQGCLIATGEGWENHCQYGYHLGQLVYYRRFFADIVAEAERTLPAWLATHGHSA